MGSSEPLFESVRECDILLLLDWLRSGGGTSPTIDCDKDCDGV